MPEILAIVLVGEEKQLRRHVPEIAVTGVVSLALMTSPAWQGRSPAAGCGG